LNINPFFKNHQNGFLWEITNKWPKNAEITWRMAEKGIGAINMRNSSSLSPRLPKILFILSG